MEKKKRWQLYLILAVIVLTIYNILPTLVYYSKPLDAPIGETKAKTIGAEIVDRVNYLENKSVNWLTSFCKNLDVKAESIELQADNPQLIKIVFKTIEDLKKFKQFLPKAGAQIQFVPSQLKLAASEDEAQKILFVKRNIGIHFDKKLQDQFFKFSYKFEPNGHVGLFYRQIINDRAIKLASGFGGVSPQGMFLQEITDNPNIKNVRNFVISMAQNIVEFENTFTEENYDIAKRFYSSFTQNKALNKNEQIEALKKQFEKTKTSIETELNSLIEKQKKQEESNQFLQPSERNRSNILQRQKKSLENALAIVQKNINIFTSGNNPLDATDALHYLKEFQDKDFASEAQILEMGEKNAFVHRLIIDWKNDLIDVELHEDVKTILKLEEKSEAAKHLKEKLNQLVINEIARVAQMSNEEINPKGDDFFINLSAIAGSKSILALNLSMVASKYVENIKENTLKTWQPQNIDLVEENYPFIDYEKYISMPATQKKLGLVLYAPVMHSHLPEMKGFRKNSIYIIAKGLGEINKKYKEFPDNKDSKLFFEDLKRIDKKLRLEGFFSYSGASYGLPDEFSKDLIFELNDYYSNILKGSREDFNIKGSGQFAILEFTDVEQRILALNKIDDQVHEELLKCKDQFSAAKVDLYKPLAKYEIAPVTKNIYLENLKLSTRKYFRGNRNRIIRWGLDLSGGKTVNIGLRDQNNEPVTNDADITEAVNELYKRVNKMGVSEVEIRKQADNIVLNFPGSQNLSASELIQASAMYFHVINEQFSTNNPDLAESVSNFLRGVWNEALVTNKKDIENINSIAWRHLGGQREGGESDFPISEDAKLLYDSGLRLVAPGKFRYDSSFDDSFSKIAILNKESFSEQNFRISPLIIVFNNYALEGSSLDKVHAGYDPSKGNRIDFTVSRTSVRAGEKTNPRKDFSTWTGQFAKDKIKGTAKAQYGPGSEGWRMAVILNDEVITAPTLSSTLSDQASISGRFSQREVNKLVADLRAGSLSYTPHILSEQNVSADLGKTERYRGILAALIGLLLVVLIMVGYYHFSGFIASIAIVFNLLIMWAVLQNLDAVLSLPGIAGIILTIGMAVDANVLVFERIREEFKISGRIATAIHTGYRKAFSAIIDSNITTIIAAFILLNFDSGPIKGFALTLIIGIASSMFTALFMTRFFFINWARNPKHGALSMLSIFEKPNFNFLSKFKVTVIAAVVIILVGSFLFVSQKQTIMGMDFTGGFAINLDLKEKQGVDYRNEVKNALIKHGANINNFEIRGLNRPNSLKLQLGIGMETDGQPFYNMPLESKKTNAKYLFENNPRITWIVKALNTEGLKLDKFSLENLSENWTSMSGQFSKTMRNQALMGLALALLAILIYITVRFEFKYAISAIIALTHDILVALSILAIFHKLGAPVQIDIRAIAAIMTIVGYSLNNTIIIFDRIREDVELFRKLSFYEVVNKALNETLGRTVITSTTTLAVLIALVTISGSSIFSFAFVMTIGVVIGTLSSLFIASPTLLYFHKKEGKVKRT